MTVTLDDLDRLDRVSLRATNRWLAALHKTGTTELYLDYLREEMEQAQSAYTNAWMEYQRQAQETK